MHILIKKRRAVFVNTKNKIIRCLERITCDKTELNKRILRLKKCFAEAEAALCGDKKK